MTIGEKIRYLRNKKNLPQEALAKKLKTTKQAIYKYESGIVTNIPTDKIELIAEILDTTPAYLMGWEEDSNIINEEKNPPEEPKLSEGEKMLLDLFRQVPEDQQQLVLGMIRAALNTKG